VLVELGADGDVVVVGGGGEVVGGGAGSLGWVGSDDGGGSVGVGSEEGGGAVAAGVEVGGGSVVGSSASAVPAAKPVPSNRATPKAPTRMANRRTALPDKTSPQIALGLC
jgi:hypothetical protein